MLPVSSAYVLLAETVSSGTASTCEFLSQQTQLCSVHSYCHQTLIPFWRAVIYDSSDHWYLCQLTMLRWLLLPLRESQVTLAHTVVRIMFIHCSAYILIMRFSYYVSLSVNGRLISLAEKEQRRRQTSCQKPFRVFVTLWHSFRSHSSSGFHSGFN